MGRIEAGGNAICLIMVDSPLSDAVLERVRAEQPFELIERDIESDEKLLRRFLKDMSAVMDERHLSDTQKLVLLSGDRALIEG